MGSERTKLNGRTCYAALQLWPYLVGVALKELELEGYGVNSSGSGGVHVAIYRQQRETKIEVSCKSKIQLQVNYSFFKAQLLEVFRVTFFHW